MTTLPAAGYLSNAARTIAEQKQALEDVRSVVAQNAGGSAETELTIAGGNVTPTLSIHNVDTEADAASDDLDHILQTNLPDGSVVMIRPNNAGRTVVARHGQAGAGQLLLADNANFSMNSTKMYLLLQRRGTDWHEVGRFYGDQKAALLTYLGAAALTGAAFTGAVSIAGAASAFQALLLQSTNADAVEGPLLNLDRASGSPANNDAVGKLQFSGRDSGAAAHVYADIFATLAEVFGGNEGGLLTLRSSTSGNLENGIRIGPGVAVGNPTGGVPSLGDINASRFLDDNVQINAGIAASQAEMEAASSTSRSVTPGTQHFHPGHPKQWLNFDGAAPAILADHGVTSVADDGTGLFSPTFDTAYSGTTYAFTHGHLESTNATGQYIKMVNATKTTTTVQFRSNSNGAAFDANEAHIALWGDQA